MPLDNLGNYVHRALQFIDEIRDINEDILATHASMRSQIFTHIREHNPRMHRVLENMLPEIAHYDAQSY